MAGMNKIERYQLQDLALTQAGQGKTTYEIAEVLCQEMAARGIDDKISRPSVSRWLKAIREERAQQTKEVVQEHIKTHVPLDLNALEEVEAFLLDKFRGRVDLAGLNGQIAADVAAMIQGDNRTRADFGMKALRVIELKLKYAGILEDPEAAGTNRGADPVDLDEFRAELEDSRKAANG